MPHVVETVYKLRDNPNTVTFEEDGVVIDFSSATRMVCEFSNSVIVADSSVTAALFNFTSSVGVVIFNFNDLAISGKQVATLRIYDGAHPDGQILTHPEGAKLIFDFQDA